MNFSIFPLITSCPGQNGGGGDIIQFFQSVLSDEKKTIIPFLNIYKMIKLTSIENFWRKGEQWRPS